MLRDFEYNPDQKLVSETLSRFDVELPKNFTILKFEVLSPDSFMWRLLIGESIYYLYAEDYVSGLDYIKSVFSKYIENKKWELVKPKSIVKFEESTPVSNAVTYGAPEDSNEMMKFAADSGYDFVFLAKSTEDAEKAEIDFKPTTNNKNWWDRLFYKRRKQNAIKPD